MRRQPTDDTGHHFLHLPARLTRRIQPPVVVLLGSPKSTARLVASLPVRDVDCYQMDLYQAGRLRRELRHIISGDQVVTAADLWDLPAQFLTAIYAVPRGGERLLKLDVLEQAYHVLRPGATLIVLSPFRGDRFLPAALKKTFGEFHTGDDAGGSVFWCRRGEDRPRRRHEVTFEARVGSDILRFLTRPGVFSHGRFDEGARALVETMVVKSADAVLDLGCGCGTNGSFAARQAQAGAEKARLCLPLLSEESPSGRITFVDSNVRAVAVAALNATANGVRSFETLASFRLDELPEECFDVVLANPPYFAHDSIARLFIDRGLALLRPGGRFHLVTKQADRIGPLVADAFGEVEVQGRRGYTVFTGVR